MTESLPAHVETLVVGSGFAGLCAAIKLDQSGRSDYLVLERNDEVGGTWRANSYPGCACDVPSHLYSFSFALNPDWQHAFSRQPQIFDYLRGVASRFGLYDRIRLNTAMTAASWDPAAARWTVQTTAGDLTADRLVLATGGLSSPSIPDLPGLDRFEGTTFHSATWDHSHDLSGERVAVVGTGASAIQFVPYVAERAGHLTVFQRTAPWVLPRRDRRYHRAERWLNRRVPGLQRTFRMRIYAIRETWVIGFALKPAILRLAERIALRMLEKQVPDPRLRAKLTPTFRLGCKRVLLSNDYYPALQRPNVEVETNRIVEVLPGAIRTQAPDGIVTEHPVDTIIFGTGFHVTDPPIASVITGRGGRTLSEQWAAEGMTALHGLTMTGFPNLFMLSGPNTGLGHNSVVLMIEAQVRYLIDLLDQMQARDATVVEPVPSRQQEYNDRLQRQLSRTVWNTGGCQSWYLDASGRNTTLWPSFTFEFMRELRRADLDEYDVVHHPQREKVPA